MLKTVQNEFITKKSFNIKKHQYGLFGIDFTLQTLALLNDNYYQDCTGKNIVEIIEYLVGKGFTDLNDFKNNYLQLRKLEFAIQNIFDTSNTAVPEDSKKQTSLLRFIKSDSNIDSLIAGIIESNKSLLNKYLGV